ncbi:MAG TPA: hypothetical protein EYG67_03510 [Campylobacterales bacterium]|nr:hypothetical protein [Campylobacterales bacterium]HIP42184.1 hypothetical protein [Campylobacterales bacterium]
MGWEIHLHLIAAVSWIGGSVFMFVLGISLKDKEDQKAVYPRVGPIFGYFEIVALMLLITTGILMIINNGLIYILFDGSIHDRALDALREKLIIVAIMTVITIVHTVIAFRANGKERTKLETIVSRGSSMGIFILNFLVLHYAIVIRDIL